MKAQIEHTIGETVAKRSFVFFSISLKFCLVEEAVPLPMRAGSVNFSQVKDMATKDSSHKHSAIRIFGPPQLPIFHHWFVTCLLSLSLAPCIRERIMVLLFFLPPVFSQLTASCYPQQGGKGGRTERGGWVWTIVKLHPGMCQRELTVPYLAFTLFGAPWGSFIAPSTIPIAGDFSPAIVLGKGGDANQQQWMFESSSVSSRVSDLHPSFLQLESFPACWTGLMLAPPWLLLTYGQRRHMGTLVCSLL